MHRLVQSFGLPLALAAGASAAQTREPITLRGIPFDTPGVTEALTALCVVPDATPPTRKQVYCNFNKSPVRMPEFEYGNVTDTALVTLDGQGALVRFYTTGVAEQIPRLIELLTEKYGTGTASTRQKSNRLGHKVEAKTHTWTDAGGTQLQVEVPCKYVNEGCVTIQSASYLRDSAALNPLEAQKQKL